MESDGRGSRRLEAVHADYTLEEGLALTWAWARTLGPSETPAFPAIELTKGLPPSWV